MRLGGSTATVADERLLVGEFQDLRHLHFMFVPLEDERTERPEDAEALGEHGPEIVEPVRPEFAVLLRQPSSPAILDEAGRTEHDTGEVLVGAWRARGVRDRSETVVELWGSHGSGS